MMKNVGFSCSHSEFCQITACESKYIIVELLGFFVKQITKSYFCAGHGPPLVSCLRNSRNLRSSCLAASVDANVWLLYDAFPFQLLGRAPENVSTLSVQLDPNYRLFLFGARVQR